MDTGYTYIHFTGNQKIPTINNIGREVRCEGALRYLLDAHCRGRRKGGGTMAALKRIEAF